jgi:tetratricopeptide (TPR) repeat protein
MARPTKLALAFALTGALLAACAPQICAQTRAQGIPTPRPDPGGDFAAQLAAKAKADVARGDLVTAAADYAAAVRAGPRNAQLRIAYGNVLLAQHDYAGAIVQFGEAERLAPASVGATMGLAIAYRGAHNYDEAKRTLEAALKAHPSSAAPLAELGDLEVELQAYDAAIGHLKAAVVLAPANIQTRERLMVAYKAKGDGDDALAQASALVARDLKNALAYYTRAQIYSDRNQDKLARKDAELVVTLQPQNRRGRELLGKILLRTPEDETPEAAKARCDEAVATLEPLNADPAAPADSDALFLLARAYRCAGNTEKAEAMNSAFEKSSKRDRADKENQTQAKHLVQQAEEQAQKNDLAGSLATVQQAIDLDPTYGAAYSQLAKIYYSQGDLERASDAIAKALERDANQPDYLYVRGRIYERQGKFEEALADFMRTVAIDPKESDAYFEMGQIYERQGKAYDAARAYANAVKLSPDDQDYKTALERVKAAAR